MPDIDPANYKKQKDKEKIELTNEMKKTYNRRRVKIIMNY
jgi:hypothetical protein